MIPSWLRSRPPDAAVEIAADRVSAAVIGERHAAPVVAAHATVPLPPGVVTPVLAGENIADPDAVANAIDEVFGRLPARPKRVALVIPDAAARVSIVPFEHEPGRRDDLDRLIRWQARKSVPFPVDDALVSYAAGRRVDGGREYLVSVARRETVRAYEAVCERASAYPGLVDVSTVCLLELFLSAPVPDGDWLLVHVRGDATTIVILRGTDVIYLRTQGGDDDSGLADLVHRTAMYYQDRLAGSGFVRVLVGGSGRGGGTLDDARRSVEDRLGLAVEPIDPTRFAAVADRISVTPALMDVLAPLVGVSLRGLRAEQAA
ncbi:MAG: hypothetical protein FJW23_01470 [Acidimicrobiia bacterium]|nr:hypothetical protein [Acidimicrobiia bacterium]